MYLSSGDFIASLLGALRRHRGSEEVAKQVAKCLIDWSQLAGAQTATADASDPLSRYLAAADQQSIAQMQASLDSYYANAANRSVPVLGALWRASVAAR